MTELPSETAALPSMPVATAKPLRLARVVWGLAFLGLGFEAIDGWSMIRAAESAPQQAAAAGIACFYLIAIYAIARAVDEMTR